MTFQRFYSILLAGAAFGRSVVKASKPSVPRHVDGAVVALEVAMMKLVKKVTGAHSLFVPNHQLLIARVGKRRAEVLQAGVEDNKDEMAGDDQMDQQRGVIQYMLDGMHRDARPRPNIDVFVVQTMRDPVQRRPM